MKFTFAPESRPLEGYTIKRAIYRGGFGEVYYALTDAGREVALKLLQNNSEVELRGVQQCLNLSHPNLVTIFDVKKDRDGDHWIVMEFVAGETLDAAIHRRPGGMPMEEVRNWLRGITEGVAFLHEQGIVHRDLKPGNVFSDGGHVKVGDVGLSKFITPSRRSAQTQSVGTVYYMAPEVAKGRYGREVDVYAMGIILYEMITGRVPFDGESTGEILMKHLSERPELEPLPPRLRPVIDTALQKDPARRFASVRELQQAFEAAVVGRAQPSTVAETRGSADGAVPAQPPVQIPVSPNWEGLQSSIWWPTRRAFYLMLAVGTMFELIGQGRRSEGVAITLLATGGTYILYTLAKRLQAPWSRRVLELFDHKSPPLPTFGRMRWFLIFCGWIFLIIMPMAHTGPDEVLEGLLMAGTALSVIGVLLHAILPTLVSVHEWESNHFRGSREVQSVQAAAPPSPPPVQPVRARVAAPQPSAGRHYYRHRKVTPNLYRAISFRSRMAQYTTAATFVVPIVAVLTGSVAMLSPDFFASGLERGFGWENIGLFGCTAVIASWVLLGLGKLNEGRRIDGGTRRLLQMAGGVAVGAAAFWLSETLLISPTPPSEAIGGTLWSQPDGAAFVSLADRPLFLEGGRPSLLGYVAFFGVLFGLRRWWWHADAFRPKRFRIGSVLLTVVLAWLVASFWSFPMIWAMTWAAVISSAVQLASPWTPPEERFATKEV